MNNLPESFVEALGLQIEEQYAIILRYRELKNNAIDTAQRQKYNTEINLRQQNIEEIQDDFLHRAQANNQHVSPEHTRQMFAGVVAQIKQELENDLCPLSPIGNPQEVSKEVKKIKLLAARNLTKAFENTHALLAKYKLDETYTPLVSALQAQHADIEQKNIQNNLGFSQYRTKRHQLLAGFLGLLDDVKEGLK